MAEVSIPAYPVEYFRSALRYEPETGLLFWNTRPRSHFKNDVVFDRFNKLFAGKKTGALKPNGYVHITMNAKTFCAHRVAWAIYYGEHPELCIDHIDHDKANNKIANLRLVDWRGNAKNLSLSSRNKSGVSGISRCSGGRYQVTIGIDGYQKYLGIFTDIETAIAVRRQAERDHGYHQNHGQVTAAEGQS